MSVEIRCMNSLEPQCPSIGIGAFFSAKPYGLYLVPTKKICSA